MGGFGWSWEDMPSGSLPYPAVYVEKTMPGRRENIQDRVQRCIDASTQGLSRADYKDFLDWLGSEVEAREMALADDDFGDDDDA